jgi:hypothetical protein
MYILLGPYRPAEERGREQEDQDDILEPLKELKDEAEEDWRRGTK